MSLAEKQVRYINVYVGAFCELALNVQDADRKFKIVDDESMANLGRNAQRTGRIRVEFDPYTFDE